MRSSAIYVELYCAIFSSVSCVSCTSCDHPLFPAYTADCTTVVILLGNRRWPCALGMNRQYTYIVAKSHCFTVRLKILDVVSHQTLIISLQNWVKGSLILMTFITANCKSDCTEFVCGVQVERLLVS